MGQIKATKGVNTEANGYIKLVFALLNEIGILPEEKIRYSMSMLLKLEKSTLVYHNERERLLSYVKYVIYCINLHYTVETMIGNYIKENKDADSDLTLKASRCRKLMLDFGKQVMNRYHNHFAGDISTDLVVLDYYLRCGLSDAFESHINDQILKFPTEIRFWKLAIKRKIATGEFNQALSLCQKCLKFHDSDAQIIDATKKIALSVKLADKLQERIGLQDINV